MMRSLRVLLAVAVMTVPVGLATSAMAQSCAHPDPTCTANQVVDNGQDAIEDAEARAGEAADHGLNTAQDALNRGQGRADDALSTVRNTIDEILGKVGDPPPGDGGGSGPGGGGGGSQGNGHDRGTTARGHAKGAASVSGGSANVGASAGFSATANETDPVSLGVPPIDLSSHPTARGSSPTIAQVAPGVISGVALMALLLGAVVAFLAVQDRVDRRDRKLVPASIGSDRVRFP